eukprot:scaffold67325_cov14-Prasinocladus_malaysianus.AAC.1
MSCCNTDGERRPSTGGSAPMQGDVGIWPSSRRINSCLRGVFCGVLGAAVGAGVSRLLGNGEPAYGPASDRASYVLSTIRQLRSGRSLTRSFGVLVDH